MSTQLPSILVLQIFHLGLGRTVCALKNCRGQDSGTFPVPGASPHPSQGLLWFLSLSSLPFVECLQGSMPQGAE